MTSSPPSSPELRTLSSEGSSEGGGGLSCLGGEGGLAGDGSAGLEVSEGLAAEIWQGEMAKYANGRQVAVLQVAASPFWTQNYLCEHQDFYGFGPLSPHSSLEVIAGLLRNALVAVVALVAASPFLLALGSPSSAAFQGSTSSCSAPRTGHFRSSFGWLQSPKGCRGSGRCCRVGRPRMEMDK